MRLLAVVPALKLIVHVPVLGRYGFFRDELYFLDCGRHLDWGYVDHAPLVGVYAKIALLLGGSLPALRILPAMAGAGTVLLTMLLARELGGGRYAQALAGLCVVASPARMAIDSLMSMNAFEPLFWTGCAVLLAGIVRTGDSRRWIAFGALAGLGLMNKHSTLLFGFAVAVALLLVRERRELLRPWVWAGGLVATVVFLPNLLWQWQRGFPTLELLGNVAATGKNVTLDPIEFVLQQVLLQHPLLAPVWVAGLFGLLLGSSRRFRILGWIYVVLLATMVALHAKNYYLAPIYPTLFAAGAVTVERRFAHARIRWPQVAILAWVSLAGIMVLPAILPYLPPERLLACQRAIGLAPPKTEVAHEGPLEQRLGDQFGWEELVAEVARIHRALPPEERARTGIVANNYGEAGALNQFGPAYGLPAPVCAHQNHYFWGPPEHEPEQWIWLQRSAESLERLCGSVERVGEHRHPWGMAEENRPIHLCRGPRVRLARIWDDLKHWN